MTLPSHHVERFRCLLERHLGIAFDTAKLPLLDDVLRRRCQLGGLEPAAFLARLEGEPQVELARIAPELTVGETYFFRNRDQFSALAEVVLPARLRSGERLRVLSAGCASGEEPYTIAIVAREAGLPPGQISIRAVDVNPEALTRAARARFGAWALRETPPQIRSALFRQDGRDLVLDEAVRAAVQFEQKNLAADDVELWSPGTYDVIFCRNVLMYFTPATMTRVVERITRALRPGGYLFLGHAETLRGVSNELALCHTHGTFYYQRIDEGRPAAPHAPGPPAATSAVRDGGSWIDAIDRATRRIRSLTEEVRAPGAPAFAAEPDLSGALALLEHERYADALALVDQAAERADVLLLRAVLLTHTGRLADAEQACHRLLSLGALGAGAHYVIALCRESAGDLAGANEHDRLALHLDPTFAMAWLHLGLLAVRAADRGGAREALGQAIVLLEREDRARLVLFGGGFQRDALISLCRAQLEAVR